MGERKKSAKEGRNKLKCASYAKTAQYVNKLARVLRCNGPEQAMRYSEKFECFAALRMLRRRNPTLFEQAMKNNDTFRRWAQGG